MAVTNPYNSQSIANYNDDPPPNDGTTGSNNVVDWDVIKDELADPIKLLSENINTQLVSSFASLVSQVNDQLASQFAFLDKTADYTIQSGDLAGELIVRVDASAGNVIIDLPTVAVMQDKIVHIICSTDPAGNSVRVDQSDSVTEIWTGYAKGDFFRLTSDGTSYIPLDEYATVYGHLALTADESIAANSKQKIFDVNYSEEIDVGGWWDSVTNHRMDVPFDCLVELDLQTIGPSSVFGSVRVSGTSLFDLPGVGVPGKDPNTSTTGIYKISAGGYIEVEGQNVDASSPFNVRGDAAKDESQFRWTLIKRLR